MVGIFKLITFTNRDSKQVQLTAAAAKAMLEREQQDGEQEADQDELNGVGSPQNEDQGEHHAEHTKRDRQDERDRIALGEALEAPEHQGRNIEAQAIHHHRDRCRIQPVGNIPVAPPQDKERRDKRDQQDPDQREGVEQEGIRFLDVQCHG